MVMLMLFVAFWDIFDTFLPFEMKLFKIKIAPLILAFGMAVITANLGIISSIIAVSAGLTSLFGAYTVFVSMSLAFLLFAIVTFAGGFLNRQNSYITRRNKKAY